MRKKLHLLGLLLFFTQVLFAQRTISGKITDDKGYPLSGVSIKIKNTNKGTSTAADGSYTLTVGDNDILEISGVGFARREVPVAGQSAINISLQTETAVQEGVVVLGSRRSGRVKMETTAPVDVVNVSQVSLPTARMDLTSVLNYTAPSFNHNKQSGSDGADHIDLATLRGLGPDQTLVLVNGKRRHQTSFVAVFGTRGRGNSGTDLNAIPASSIDRVEILRDGASAQYGSDAIAGVMNLILKKGTGKLTGSVGYSGYFDSKFNPAFEESLQTQYIHGKKFDGNAFSANLNYGVPLGKKGGFINFSLDGITTGKTFRQALDTSNYKTNDDAMYIDIYRRANGDASLDMIGGMFNAELPVCNKYTAYAFGGINRKNSDAYAFTRNFSARPERFPTTSGGGFIGSGDILHTTNDGETFYNPHIQTEIGDVSMAMGLKGKTKYGWNWDFSNTLGRNKFHFFGDKTFNASLGNGQTHFDDGGFTFLQNTVNANFSKQVDAKTSFAWGAELRSERYTIFAGEEASYKNYSDGSKATGAQGFPGYQPGDEVKAKRTVVGAYIDIEQDVSEKFLVDGALRGEHYSDFGYTGNFKLAMRYKTSPNFNIRASASTGFRAPSLQQINFSSTFTTVQAGNIAEVKIAPNYSPITQAAGIPKLKQEKSLNAGIGFAWKASQSFNITVDGYYAKVKDRVVLSGQFDGSDPNLDADLRNQMADLSVALAQFFANAASTTNKGVDVVMDYNHRMGDDRVRILFAANLQDMTIDKINVPEKLSGSDFLKQTFFSDREQKFLLASAPKTKAALSGEYGKKNFSIGARVTYFGKITLNGYGQDGLGIAPTVPLDNGGGDVPDLFNYRGKVVGDIYASTVLNKNWTLYFGVDNVLNTHPDFGVVKGAKDWAYNTETGGSWDAVQMGFNGRRVFARLAFNF